MRVQLGKSEHAGTVHNEPWPSTHARFGIRYISMSSLGWNAPTLAAAIPGAAGVQHDSGTTTASDHAYTGCSNHSRGVMDATEDENTVHSAAPGARQRSCTTAPGFST